MSEFMDGRYLYTVDDSVSTKDIEAYFDKIIYEDSLLGLDAWDIEDLFGEKNTIAIGLAGCAREDDAVETAVKALELAKKNLGNKPVNSVMVAMIGSTEPTSLITVTQVTDRIADEFGEQLEDDKFKFCSCLINDVLETHSNPIEVMIALA